MSITSKSRKGKMSSLDPSSNELQLLDEDEEEDPDHDLEAEEDHKDKGLHSSRSFQPSPQQLLGRLHEKPEVDSYQEKWPTLVASCTPLTTKQQCIGYERLRDRAQGFGQEAPKMRLKRTKGENEEEEGHINRSTGSKDKQSKVCTSKGLRDRRVRLSANTAIDFYDVQDRLGFDRPSKAIDWLMKKAKVAIDALGNQSKIAQLAYQEFEGHIPSQIHYQTQKESKFPNPEYDIQNQQNLNDNPNFSFISMICGSSSSTSIDFHNNQHDLNPRTRSQTQDLCLSIQSLQEDQTLLQEHSSPHSLGEHQHSLFSGSTPVNTNTTSNMDWFQKMIAQNSNSEGFAIYSPERNLEQILDQTQLFYQREPLQSTFLPSICASLMNTQLPNIDYLLMPAFNSASVTGTGLAYNEFSDYPQIQGQEVVAVNPTSNRSSSASSFLNYED